MDFWGSRCCNFLLGNPTCTIPDFFLEKHSYYDFYLPIAPFEVAAAAKNMCPEQLYVLDLKSMRHAYLVEWF